MVDSVEPQKSVETFSYIVCILIIEELVTSEGYEVHSLQCVSHPDARYKSFKLSVPITQLHSIYNADFPWPEGVRVRKFISPAKKTIEVQS